MGAKVFMLVGFRDEGGEIHCSKLVLFSLHSF
jgi:hypothetical protein